MARDKVGRNDSCPCGSGKKYKQCCENKKHSLSPGAWMAIVGVAVAAVVAVVMSFSVTAPPPSAVACPPGQVWSGEHGHCHQAPVHGHLSLAQSQIACWTIAVGGVVLGYGLIRLQISDIPESLLGLMGASLATGGAGFFKDGQNKANAEKAGAVSVQRSLAWSDLVRTYKSGQPPELSLAKAQMLFWTVLLLALFVLKSILEGAIWEVPWPLVFLMGFSQAGYLAPKLTEGSAAPPAPAAPGP